MFYYKNARTGFFSNELNVYSESNFYKPDKRYLFEECKSDCNYNILFIKSGTFIFECGNSLAELSYGDVAITRPFEDFKLFTKHSNSENQITEFRINFISFHQTLFAETKGDDNYLRAFTDRELGTNNIYKKSDFSVCSIDEGIIMPISNYTKSNLGFYHFQSAVGMLISQICLIFDKKHNKNSSETTGQYQVKIFDYIQRNACNNITIKSISEKFNVSSWYINNVTHKFYNDSFRNMIICIRMYCARNMMKQNDSLVEISRLCGYTTYSGFYRTYLDFFGISPKNDRMYFKKHCDFYNKLNTEGTPVNND